jgi:hypothetical protein
MTLRRLAAAERQLVLAALLLLAVVRIALWLLPFQRMLGFLKGLRVRDSGHGRYTVNRLAWAVRVASRYIPGVTCLSRSLTMYSLLRRYGHVCYMHIGVYMGAAPPTDLDATHLRPGQI